MYKVKFNTSMVPFRNFLIRIQGETVVVARAESRDVFSRAKKSRE